MTPPVSDAPTPQDFAPFYITGGTMPRDHASYVTRQADETLFAALKQGQLCYVLTARQMGKSSLMVRTAARLTESQVLVAVLDLNSLGQNLTVAQWYEGMLNRIGRQLHLEDPLDAFWQEHADLPPLVRWLQAIEEVLLPQTNGAVVLFIDEIDMVRSLPFPTDEFFAAIRACYNRRDREPMFRRLTFCLLGVASPADLIHNVDITPFNIGKRIELNDFTVEEASALAVGISVTGREGKELLTRVLHWTNGHPYLTQRLCLAVAEESAALRDTDVDRLCAELFLSKKAQESDDNLAIVRNRLLHGQSDLMALLDKYRRVLEGRRVPDEEANPLCVVLKLSGVTCAQGGLLRIRNRIYGQVFDRAWVTTHLPGAETRRQRAAFRRGLAWASALAGVVLTLIGGLTAVAIRNAQRAQANARLAREAALLAGENERLAHAEAAKALAEKIRADRNAAAATAARDEANRNAAQLKAALKAAAANLTAAKNSADHVNALLYIANMNLIPASYAQKDFVRMRALLAETRASKYRGFEWGYWNHLCHLDLLTLTGPRDVVNGVAFSPDGRRIVTGGRDTACIWDAATGKPLLTFITPDYVVRSVAFSPDGRRIVTVGMGNAARVWNSATGQMLFTLSGHSSRVNSAAFSPDGRRIVTGSDDRTARIWDADTGQAVSTIKADGLVVSVGFSPDGQHILTVSSDHGIDSDSIKVWNVATGQELLNIKVQIVTQNGARYGDLFSAAFSPDGRHIVSARGARISQDIPDTCTVWDAATGKALFSFGALVNSMAYSPDGRHIVTGSEDHTATVWDADTGKAEFTLEGHSSQVKSVAFSPDGKRILTGSWDGTARVWEAAGSQKDLAAASTDGVLSVAFSPDGRRIVDADRDGIATLWDAKTGRVLHALKGHVWFVVSVAYSPDGRHIVTGGYDHTVRVWDADTGQRVFLIQQSARVTSVAYSPDGRRIVTGCEDKTARVWDAGTGKQLQILSNGVHGRVPSVAFSPNGKRIVTGSQDGTVRFWDADTGKPLLTLTGHTAPIDSLAFSPNGQSLVTGSDDHTARVWDAHTGQPRFLLAGATDRVRAVGFSPDGRRIVTASGDGFRIWDATTGQEVFWMASSSSPGTVKSVGSIGIVTSVAFSPDGRSLISG
ncbi:MAG TPA: AAA-like domain-containing protein, partial [Chthonomonadaceae bacterium]|nr:AAA-like domain-containing protein [Chthonomonadaceae bacterium]